MYARDDERMPQGVAGLRGKKASQLSASQDYLYGRILTPGNSAKVTSSDSSLASVITYLLLTKTIPSTSTKIIDP